MLLFEDNKDQDYETESETESESSDEANTDTEHESHLEIDSDITIDSSDREEIRRVLRKLITKNPMMYLGIPHSKLEMINKIQINLSFVTDRGIVKPLDIVYIILMYIRLGITQKYIAVQWDITQPSISNYINFYTVYISEQLAPLLYKPTKLEIFDNFRLHLLLILKK